MNLSLSPRFDQFRFIIPKDYIPQEVRNNTFTVTFRQNQGLYNYFMLYESIFHRYMKPELYHQTDNEVFDVVFLDEDSLPVSRMMLYQPEFNGISGLEFSYDKVERQTDTFDVTFTFNNIDFDFLPSL